MVLLLLLLLHEMMMTMMIIIITIITIIIIIYRKVTSLFSFRMVSEYFRLVQKRREESVYR